MYAVRKRKCTNTIGKLAHRLRGERKRVVLAAGDTFRAAAIDQLKIWGERLNVPVVAHQPNADPGAVVFDAMQAAHNRNMDVLIIDTAGRLHTKFNLMAELNKIKKIIQKTVPEAPQEVVLVIDATTGQNGLTQARIFAEVVDVTGIVLTKLDGSAKGGIVVQVQRELGVPVKLVGLGEGADDLAPFDAEVFIDALLDQAA